MLSNVRFFVALSVVTIAATVSTPVSGAIVTPSEQARIATYQIEGLYDMVGLGSWNGQPVSETNQPSIWIRRLAANVSIYSDTNQSDRLWITVTNIITTQGAYWFGSPAYDVQLTGLGFQFNTPSTSAAVGTSYSGDFALAGQSILTQAGGTPTDITPGYAMNVIGGTTWVRCANGTNYGMTNFGGVTGLTVLTGSAVFQLDLDQPVSSIDWSATSLVGRFGVDHQFVQAALVPTPGVLALLALVGGVPRRRR